MDLGAGATRKWNVSQRFSFVIDNPSRIPGNKFSGGFNQWYAADIPDGHRIDFPANPLIGNDDPFVAPNENNPYELYEGGPKHHAVGQLTTYDMPSIYMPDGGESPNTYIKQSFLAQDFVRLQIGTAWYVVSDPVKWKVVETLIYSNQSWQDNPDSTDSSQLAPGN